MPAIASIHEVETQLRGADRGNAIAPADLLGLFASASTRAAGWAIVERLSPAERERLAWAVAVWVETSRGELVDPADILARWAAVLARRAA